MLVINLDALQTVNLLDFVNQILGELFFTEHAQNIMRIARTVHERFAGAHKVALVDTDVLALGDQVFFRLTDLRGHHDLALALGVLAERDDAVDLRDHGELFRFAGFEKFGNIASALGIPCECKISQNPKVIVLANALQPVQNLLVHLPY